MTQDEDKSLRFRCPHCAVKLRGKQAEAGSRRQCPKCKQSFRIPRPKVSAVEQLPTEQPLVPVICTVCRTRMYAGLDQVGSLMECPDCFTQNVVKPPPQKVKSTGPNINLASGYEVGPESDTSAPRSYAQEIIEGAEREVEQQLDEEPETPQQPFLSGVFTFPFYAHAWPVVLGMALSLSIACALVKLAWDMKDSNVLLAPFVVGAAIIMLLLVSVPTLVCWLTVFENTLQGEDDADVRPEGGLLAFVDWAGELGYLALALSLSCTPSVLASKLLDLPIHFLPVLAFIASLAFPVFLLSMMESATPLGAYSKPIWASLYSLWGKWLKFYFFGTLLLALAGVSIVGLLWLGTFPFGPLHTTGAIAVIYACVVFVTIYFRLLGRLGWLLTQEIEIEQEVADELAAESDGISQVDDPSKVSLGV